MLNLREVENMELMFLGTGAGRPTKERNVTAIILNLLVETGKLWLFDCGEGTQHQFVRSGVNINKLQNIFITHLHGDHLFGLPGLLSSLSLAGKNDGINLYGPAGLKAYIEMNLQVSNTYLNYPLQIIEIEEGCIINNDLFKVEAFALQHRIPCYGYRITERDKPGSLDDNRLKAEGVQPGPLFALLKKGKNVKLDDGRVINGGDYLKPVQSGKVLAIFGDTAPAPQSKLLAKNVDMLIHEATLEAAMQEKANNCGHTTTIQAAMLAKESGAKHLVITHISSRYEDKDIQRLLAECQEIFSNTEIASDFAVFPI